MQLEINGVEEANLTKLMTFSISGKGASGFLFSLHRVTWVSCFIRGTKKKKGNSGLNVLFIMNRFWSGIDRATVD